MTWSSSLVKNTNNYWDVGSKIDDNVKLYRNITKRDSSKNLKSVWDQYKSKTTGHGFNNMSFNNLSRIITPPSIKQNKSIPSYDYYEPNISKGKSLLENWVLSITKSTNVDNRTDSKLYSKLFDAKLNITLNRT